jgi:hypothetical protein
LQTMEDWQFHHHTMNGSDFATWVRDCFGDKFLAKRLEGAKSIEDLQKEIFISLFR